MRKLDQHFTDEELADALVADVVARLDPERRRYYIEPSCGDGSFVKALIRAGVARQQIFTIDIDPKLKSDHCGDFLLFTPEQLNWPHANSVVIGNPPFGFRGKVARQFLGHAGKFAPWVLFVMPRSLEGTRNCTNIQPRWQLMYEKRLDGGFGSTNAKCNWQEWYLMPAGEGRRFVEELPPPCKLYALVAKDDDYDIVIQRCGASAGSVTTCNGTGQGKYYIKTSDPLVFEAFQHLEKPPEASIASNQDTISLIVLHRCLEKALLAVLEAKRSPAIRQAG